MRNPGIRRGAEKDETLFSEWMDSFCARDIWRDKSGREVDFVLRRRKEVDAVECQVNPDRFVPTPLSVSGGASVIGRRSVS